MARTPWLTSQGIIESVKRKIALPTDQVTFSDDDILRFANEEMFISQVPSVLIYHEEYFVTTVDVPLVSGISRYPIPDRAIGMKLRDLFYKDVSGNLLEMTRIDPEDKSFFQAGVGGVPMLHKFYLENNDVVLVPEISTSTPTGSLNFIFFLRPNQLVADSRAAISKNFVQTLTVTNATLAAGDTVTINGVVFTAVSSAPSTNEFLIDATDILTASNLVTAINANGVVVANNGTPNTNIVTLKYTNLKYAFASSNSTALTFTAGQGIEFNSVPNSYTDPVTNEVSDLFVNGAQIDFLQTKPGHKIYSYDVTLPANSISGNIIQFAPGQVPSTFIVGDYICLANECIIPFLPPDLHNGLAERTCARILSAQGDQQGLQSVNQKIQEIETRQGNLLDNRVEGAPKKVTQRKSLLSYSRLGVRRRL